VLDNYRAELSHPFTKPSWYTASVKRKIGGAGTLHASILIAIGRREKKLIRSLGG
jgi:phenylalanyl-tRNA synthetase alpha subunit